MFFFSNKGDLPLIWGHSEPEVRTHILDYKVTQTTPLLFRFVKPTFFFYITIFNIYFSDGPLAVLPYENKDLCRKYNYSKGKLRRHLMKCKTWQQDTS